MSDEKSSSDANRNTGHRLIIGATRDGCTRVDQELTRGKHNFQWIDDCGGSAGKTKQAVTLIDSFVKNGGLS